MQEASMLVEKRWALLDVEFIRTSATHRCIRKLYILCDNGFIDMELEFFPCVPYKDLELKYQRSFQYCKRRIHKLCYNPRCYSPKCLKVLPILNEFILDNDINLILYKGGTIERDLSKALDVSSLDIECFELEKVQSHDPYVEVNGYFSQIVEIL